MDSVLLNSQNGWFGSAQQEARGGRSVLPEAQFSFSVAVDQVVDMFYSEGIPQRIAKGLHIGQEDGQQGIDISEGAEVIAIGEVDAEDVPAAELDRVLGTDAVRRRLKDLVFGGQRFVFFVLVLGAKVSRDAQQEAEQGNVELAVMMSMIG